MKLTNTFFRVLKSAIFLIALFLVMPQRSMAASKPGDLDIGLNWNCDDLKIRWEKKMAAFYIDITVYDEAGDDDWLENINIYCNGKSFIKINSYWGGSSNARPLKVSHRNGFGNLYMSYNGWRSISSTETEYSVGKTDGTRSLITFVWFPPAGCMDQDVTIKINGYVKDSGGDSYFYDRSITQTTSTFDYEPKLTSGGWDLSTGNFKVTLTELTNGDAYSETKSTINLRTKTHDGSWTKRKVSYTTSKGQKTINKTWGETSYVKYSDYNNTKILTAHQFANGISISAVAVTDPDAGSGNYTEEKVWSSSIHTGRTAVFENRNLTITQNNRDINLSWQVYNPSSSSNLNTADFAVEKWNGSEWVEIETIDYNYSKSSYSYTYTLSDAECNKGSQTYKFRVWKKMFAKQEWWHEYMSTNETSATIYTDYKKVEITSISPVEGKTEAIVKWAFTSSNGIWDDKGAYSLSINGGGNSHSFTPAYNETQYKISSLQGCVRYEVSLSQTALSKSHHTSATKSFLMPNLKSREIENFEVSKGYYSDNVMLSWNVPSDASDFKYFNITRTPIGGGTHAVQVTQIQHSGLTSYSYQDKAMNAGQLYTYTIEGYSECDGSPSLGASVSDIGFSQPYATVSGRIAYAGDQAVPGVTVAVTGGDNAQENYSVFFNGADATSHIKLPADVVDFKNNDEITFQAWINPDKLHDGSFVFSKNSTFDVIFGAQNTLKLYILGAMWETGKVFNTHEWVHLTFIGKYDRNASKATMAYYINGEFIDQQEITTSKNVDQYIGDAFYVAANSKGESGYRGYIDEIRFWNKALDSATIANNYNAYLSGREEGLWAYYRCNEMGVQQVFDQSGRNGVFNRRDGELGVMANHSTMVPSAEQLSNKTVTDVDGNYLINTIPYTLEGVQYNVVPLFGVHEFSPNKKPIYVSPSSVVFNNIDFEDVSSFEVEGVVYYENTTMPVEGCSFYIDGNICSRDGEMVTTDVEGKFKISVPIGDHFIQVKKQGHVFANDGRFPADPNGLGARFTFEQPMKDLTFTDITKVTVAGRVVGGEVEEQKPIGLGLSKANIGQAIITLTSGYKMNMTTKTDGTSVSYEVAQDTLVYENSTSDVNSRAYVLGGDVVLAEQIVVETDPVTGEFAIQLPPAEYTVKSVNIPSNTEIIFSTETIATIDASKPLYVKTDSIVDENGNTRKFEYLAALKLAYRVTPDFAVIHNNDGSFGEKTFKYTDIENPTGVDIDLYTLAEDGSVNYVFGNPVFFQNTPYTFKLRAFEEYVNMDGVEPQYDQVPLQNTVVTLINQFGTGQFVCIEGENDGLMDTTQLAENQVQLDSVGAAEYRFIAGFPNIIEPYTLGLNIKYNTNGQDLEWDQNSTFKAIVFGELPSGTNFVTSGPDKVMMILRDPAGSNSYSFYEKGVTVTEVEQDGGSFVTNNEVTTITKLGVEANTFVGSPIGFGVITEAKSKFDLEVGLNINYEYSGYGEWSTTTTATELISTSGEPDYVGSNGDVFVGVATNILFGNARSVGLQRNPTDNTYAIERTDVITTGSEFSTGFKYTQFYVENILIPNLYLNRDALLQQVSSIDSVENNTDEAIFVTTLSPDDERFGSDNFNTDIWGAKAVGKDKLVGPSYTMVLPKVLDPNKMYEDKVRWYNSQIAKWEQTLADNEEAKVKAIKERETYLKENHSFDAGVTIESSISTCESEAHNDAHTFEAMAVAGLSTGGLIAGTGVAVTAKTTTGGRYFGYTEDSEETCLTTGYVLQDAGYNDALTIDVLNSPDGFGPIFSTRGGQTSCPYEAAEVTKYYEPGTEISTATMQIEIPQLTVVNAFATEVPAGKAATYTLRLENLSETGDDIWFDLGVIDATNPKGAIITMDGAPLTETGRAMLVPAGSTLEKTIQLKQSDLGVLDFENIQIVLKSECQGDIADTVSISANFVPSCSDITLQIEDRILNSYTGSDLQIVVKDFDRAFRNFKGVRIQYKGERDTEWTLAQEYVVNEDDKTEANILLSANSINYIFDMSNSALLPDQTYMFRAITMCDFGSGEIHNESETISVIKDMTKPMLLGNPSPANGILTADGEVSVTFNEDIKASSLRDVDNFIVKAKLNGYRVDHSVAMNLTEGAPATTEADIDLSARDFAFNFWLNYSNAGTVIEHGQASTKFVVALNDAGNLVVTINGNVYTSTATVPADKWVFMSVSYKYAQGNSRLTAHYAIDASSVELFMNNAVDDYFGNGRLAVGEGLNAKMHELTMWNNAREFAVAQSEMYESKRPSTPNLIGYWRMDEGHGTVAKDCVRNRHLTLPATNAWYIAGENVAITLNGEQYAAMNIATVAPYETEDFMFELWFRGDKQSGASTLFTNSKGFSVGFDAEGNLLMHNAQCTMHNYLDNQWHHLAINSLRNGATILYVDGVAVKQIASKVSATIASDRLVIGADRYHPESDADNWEYRNYFRGEIDEIRLWNASLTADYIRENMHNRVDADAEGLAAYYPFEKTTVNEYNQAEVVFDLADHSANSMGELEVSELNAQLSTENTPALKVASELQNVAFSFVASERKVVINLNEAADIIEGTTIQFTVRDVYDANNNLSIPVIWNAYVQRNLLKWSENEITINKQSLETRTFSVDVINKGAASESWYINNLPTWLTADVEAGSLNPLSDISINFTISAALPIGRYEEVIYLVGNNNIYEPLVVTVNVIGETPDWSVNPDDFEHSMSMIGQLQVAGITSEDVEDRVAAFIDGECVGIASPIYNARYDAYFVMLNIYSNGNNQPVAFKVFDASTGNVYPAVETSSAVTFVTNSVIGNMNNPFIWNAKDLLEQTINMNRGWNWSSLYVEPESNLVTDILSPIASAVEIAKDKSSYAMYGNRQWRGGLTEINVGKMYKVKMRRATTLSVVGEKVNPSDELIKVNSGWNWIGYTTSFNLSVADAFADLNPQDGDVVKSKNDFAIYNSYEWVGTLTALAPGSGYMYYSTAKEVKEFTYPSQSSAQPSQMRVVQRRSNEFIVDDNSNYSGNMTIVAVVKNGDVIETATEVGVFAGAECRGANVSEADGLVFLTIAGEGYGDVLTFKVKVGNKIYEVEETIIFEDDAILGTIEEPMVISIDASIATNVEDKVITSANVYTCDGQLVVEGWDADYVVYDAVGRIIYTGSAQSISLPRGVYMVHLGGETQKVVL